MRCGEKVEGRYKNINSSNIIANEWIVVLNTNSRKNCAVVGEYFFSLNSTIPQCLGNFILKCINIKKKGHLDCG